MDTNWGLAFMGIGFGSLLFIIAIGLSVYGIVWLIKQHRKSEVVPVYKEYAEIWKTAAALSELEKDCGIINKEGRKEQVSLHICRMLEMIQIKENK